jgi:hypothetical protein
MKPICVPCKRFFRAKQSGFYFIEGMPKANDARPGTQDPDQWQPYKLWVGDLYECPGCHATIVSGFGNGPIAERHHTDFAAQVNLLGADQFQVNDC